MNTGQTMITLFAMILLSFLILRVNNTFLQTNTTLYTTKFEVLGYSVAQSMIQEIERLDFDENTVTAAVSDSTKLSTTLGPDGSGETTSTTFDDIDDYNNYTRTDTIPAKNGVVFNIKCKVEYVTAIAPDVVSSTPTWQKRITIYVTSPYMLNNTVTNQYYTKVAASTPQKQDTIKLSQVFSYWIFK